MPNEHLYLQSQQLEIWFGEPWILFVYIYSIHSTQKDHLRRKGRRRPRTDPSNPWSSTTFKDVAEKEMPVKGLRRRQRGQRKIGWMWYPWRPRAEGITRRRVWSAESNAGQNLNEMNTASQLLDSGKTEVIGELKQPSFRAQRWRPKPNRNGLRRRRDVRK